VATLRALLDALPPPIGSGDRSQESASRRPGDH